MINFSNFLKLLSHDIVLFIHLFIQQVFIEWLQSVKYLSKIWRHILSMSSQVCWRKVSVTRYYNYHIYLKRKYVFFFPRGYLSPYKICSQWLYFEEQVIVWKRHYTQINLFNANCEGLQWSPTESVKIEVKIMTQS